jgi:hypothetical protein
MLSRKQTPNPFRPNVNFLGLVVCIVGATTPVMLNVIGELYLVEILLPVLALAILFFSGGWALLGERPFLTMTSFLFVMLVGYLISDLVVGSRPEQYLRGWGRLILVAVDFIAYYVILAKDRRLLWWLTLGMGIGGVTYLAAQGLPLTQWKIGYAEQTVLVVLALTCYLPGRFKALPIAALGPLSMWLDYRSFGAICLAISSYVWFISGKRGLPAVKLGTLAKYLAAGVCLLVLINWLLVATSDKDSLQRRAQSNAGRQASIETALFAIERSPLIGFGSWSEDRELARMERKLGEKYAGDQASNQGGGGGIGFQPHSQVLHAWVEGGILAAVFFFYLFFQVVNLGPWIVFKRQPDLLSPILVYYLINTGWSILMSPFAGMERMQIGLGAAILVVSEIDRRRNRRANVVQVRHRRQVLA